jgi:hypothetical protein
MPRAIPLLGIVLLAALPARAAEYAVDASAAPGGDGSPENPFQTINEVKTVLVTGDTVLIRDGVYNETVDFWHVEAGTGGRTTIKAAPGASPVIDGGGADNFIFQAGETPFMTFEGLTVRNAGGSGFHFYHADDGQVLSCKTESVGRSVDFYFSSRGYVSGSDLQGGVSGKGSAGTILENNYIWGSSAEGITLHQNSHDCMYLGNVVYDNSSVNIYIDSAWSMVVDGNLVYMTGDPPEELAGIQLADESYEDVTSPVLRDITVTNNVILNTYYGFVFWEGEFPGESAMRNVVVAGNTIVDSKGVSITWDEGPHENAVFRDNVVVNGPGTGLLLLIAKSTSGVTLDHNLWFMPDVAEPFNWGGGTVFDHAGWTGVSGQGAGDVLLDPIFEGSWILPVENFRLAEGSPAIDAGVETAGLDHDFDGNGRPAGAAVDLGAFERGATTADDVDVAELPEREDTIVTPDSPDAPDAATDVVPDTSADLQGDVPEEGNGEDSGCGCSLSR